MPHRGSKFSWILQRWQWSQRPAWLPFSFLVTWTELLYTCNWGCWATSPNKKHSAQLLQLCLFFPVSTASSKRSFSALRCLKTWLCNTVSQKRLTHMALLHVHRGILDDIYVLDIMREFISITPEPTSTFGVPKSSLDAVYCIYDTVLACSCRCAVYLYYIESLGFAWLYTHCFKFLMTVTWFSGLTWFSWHQWLLCLSLA